MSTVIDEIQSRYGALDRLLRRHLLARLEGLRHGRLRWRDALGTAEFGAAERGGDPVVEIEVQDPAFYRALAANGSVGAGGAYIDGLWRCAAPGADGGGALVALGRLMLRNRDLLDGFETGLARIGGAALRAWNGTRRNSRDGSRRNIAAHYDLGNEFFATFLSADRMYSSALWDGPDDTLEAASTRKLDAVCRRLDLRPDDHVVEIGSGWGGFALHAARHYGCRVTTTTISREQYAVATERVAAAGLGARIEVRLDDYRDLAGTYDKLASIEMIEAVGAEFLGTYFGVIERLLKPGGLALLQAITIEDHRYELALRSVDYIKRYVFPGSFIPSLNAILAAKTEASELRLRSLEDFAESYARTLEAWRERFTARRADVRALGKDERFIRLWEFYLAYCEAGFRERSIGVAHLLFEKPGTPGRRAGEPR
ncbi:MAG: class I SAM-dependent methyltransferase [Gammaproteobacteria bacterium]|nr:class I SAM-dependent methyltransferase [Gammaproteobacteria bacterium]